MFAESRVGVCRQARRFENAALIDAHINNNRSFFHTHNHLFANEHRRATRLRMQGTDDDIGSKKFLPKTRGLIVDV